MSLFRYRKPSVKTLTGVTKAKKRIKKSTGITAATKPLRYRANLERRAKRKVGYYSAPAKMIRNKKVPTPLGCSMTIVMLMVLLSGLMIVLL